jgi:hypothetical protein
MIVLKSVFATTTSSSIIAIARKEHSSNHFHSFIVTPI